MSNRYSLFLVVCCCLSSLALVRAQEDDEQPPPSSAPKCISCDWISPEMQTTLFELSAYVQSKCKTPDEVRTLKKDGLDPNWVFLLNELESFEERKSCDLDTVGKLTALEARLEEGEQMPPNLEAFYETKVLSLYMEQIHLKLLDVCRAVNRSKLREWKADKELQETRDTFVKFAEYLKEHLAKYRADHQRGFSFWFTGLLAGDRDESDRDRPEFEHGTDLQSRGKAILGRDYLFEKIKPIAKGYFGDRATCLATMERHSKVAERLNKTLEPLRWLANYSWQYFVHNKIASGEKKSRKQMDSIRDSQDNFLKSSKTIADLLALQGFMSKTLARRDELCSA